MLHATCHCGAVRLDLPGPPEHLIDCNCSICRRYGALWAFYPAEAIGFTGHPEHTTPYLWGAMSIRTMHCRHCGCVTHWERLEPRPGAQWGVNMRLLPLADIAGIRVRQFDGADEWRYLD